MSPALLNTARCLLVAMMATALAACQEAQPSPPPQPAPPILQGQQLRFPPGHPQLAQIGLTAAVQAQPVTVELPARLVWNEDRTQRVYPAFAGRVSRVVVDVGQAVRPGAVLAQLASPEFGAAQADTAKAQVDLALSQKALDRQRDLFQAGVLARKELEQAEADLARTGAELRRARARTALYGASGEGVNASLPLLAGIGGVVVDRNLTPGQELRPEQVGTGVPPLFVISDPTSLWVQIDARESEAAALRPGASFELVVPALDGARLQGTVIAAADFIDPATRTIKVRGLVANPERRLKAEMLATALVQRDAGTGVLVPAQSIMLRDARHYVMVQVQPGVFAEREVGVTRQGAREALVASGLRPGEEVVSDNTLLLARQYRLAQESARPGVSP